MGSPGGAAANLAGNEYTCGGSRVVVGDDRAQPVWLTGYSC